MINSSSSLVARLNDDICRDLADVESKMAVDNRSPR